MSLHRERQNENHVNRGGKEKEEEGEKQVKQGSSFISTRLITLSLLLQLLLLLSKGTDFLPSRSSYHQRMS